MTWRRRSGSRPLVIAHRGASAERTENTLEAFEAARDAGADGIELDVRLCGSGEVVVFHDDDLRRLAARGDRIDVTPWVKLRGIRLVKGLHIPRLDTVLGEIGGLINIELKADRRTRRALVERVVTLIDRHGARDRVLISSFDPLALLAMRRRAPRLPTGFLFHSREPMPLARAWVAPWIRPFALNPRRELIVPENMMRWRRSGYAVITWTIDAPYELAHVARLGVDAVITNDPRRALQTL